MSSRKKKTGSLIQVRGMFRVQLTKDENGRTRVVGDSGWNKNLVTNLGFDQFLCQTLAGMAGSKTVSYMALGTGGAPVATDTSLASELTDTSNSRKTVSPSTIASKTVQFTAAFNSSDSFITNAGGRSISNVGLFNVSTTNAGTLFAGNTYSSSLCQTNNNVNVSYQIRFATA